MRQAAHGGDIVTYLERYGGTPLDFSANTNPMGMSPLAQRAAAEALKQADRYPDPQCRALRGAVAQTENVAPEQVWCGSGAADLIYRIVLAHRPGRALIPAPTFSEYENALTLAGCRISRYFLSERKGFALGEDILPMIRPGLDMLFLCEPNNPTGLVSPPELLYAVAERCKREGVLLVADECFGGFLSHAEQQSCKRFLGETPNLVIVKAFTKLYGMAGLRLGYLLCADAALVERIASCGPPWPVSVPAQAAGTAALRDTAYVRQSTALITREREIMRRALTELGCRVYPGQANFLFFYSGDAGLHHKLAEKGFLIRDCSNYVGLEAGYYRTAVRTGPENQALIKALAEIKL